jgi:hypothetical protein
MTSDEESRVTKKLEQRYEEAAAREAAQKVSPSHVRSPSSDLKPNQEKYVKNIRFNCSIRAILGELLFAFSVKIKNFMQSSRPSLCLEPCNAFLRKLIYNHIHSK